jgi:hypothetical protein
MRRRDKGGGKTQGRRRKASKRQNGLKARDRDETLEQLTATSEVLEAISHSTFDLQIVLATLVKTAGRLCQAENVQIFLYDGEFYRCKYRMRSLIPNTLMAVRNSADTARCLGSHC